MSTESVLTQPMLRGLADKVYEKRKHVALQIEQMVREFARSNADGSIASIVSDLTERFVSNTQVNARKGGLIGLAAVAIGLSTAKVGPYLDDLVRPVLRSFADVDARVRYYALESMYNVAKVGRGGVLVYFNELFDGLGRLSADLDQAVKSGAQLLDRLMKDIISESEIFDVEGFIELLQERIGSENPFVRQFLVSWIVVLDSVPEIDLLNYLPAFLDGLFNMLADINAEIRRLADGCLSEFLREIEEADAVDFESMVAIVVHHTGSENEFVQLTALLWASRFIMMGQGIIIPYVAALLANVLPCLSHEVDEITTAAIHVNQHLLSLLSVTEQPFEYEPLLRAATAQLSNPWPTTRESALRWMLMLHLKSPAAVAEHMELLVESLLTALHDPTLRVVKLVLEVLSKLTSFSRDYFVSFVAQLVAMVHASPDLLLHRVTLIVRQLAVFLDPEELFVELASLLRTHANLDFAADFVSILNLILLTAPELASLRAKLNGMASSDGGITLFTLLFPSWAHDPVAALALCLLSQAYETGAALVARLGELNVTVHVLTEIDKLVQLLESPVFTALRLQLLHPHAYPHLNYALYGLLMLLPQSSAYTALASRLSAASALTATAAAASVPSRPAVPDPLTASPDVSVPDLLAAFDDIQARHSAALLARIHDSAVDDATAAADPGAHALPAIPVDPDSTQADTSRPSRPTTTRTILDPVAPSSFFAAPAPPHPPSAPSSHPPHPAASSS